VVINGRAGWMTEPGDVHGLAHAAEHLWEDPTTCREMRNEGRRLMEERFNKVRQFDAFLDHFGTHAAGGCPQTIIGRRGDRSIPQG